MKYNMTAIFVQSLTIAEPLVAVLEVTLNYVVWIMDTTVGAGMRR